MGRRLGLSPHLRPGPPWDSGGGPQRPTVCPTPPPRPPRRTLTCSAPEPGTCAPSGLASQEPGRQVASGERPARTSAPLPLTPPHLPCSDRRLPPAAALASPAPGPASLRPPGTQSNGNAAAGAVPQLAGRGVSVTPVLGLGQMEGKGCLGLGASLLGLRKSQPCLPSLPSPHLPGEAGQSLNTLNQYFLSPYSGLGVV